MVSDQWSVVSDQWSVSRFWFLVSASLRFGASASPRAGYGGRRYMSVVGIRCTGFEEFSSGVLCRGTFRGGKVNGVSYLGLGENGTRFAVRDVPDESCRRRNDDHGSGLWNDCGREKEVRIPGDVCGTEIFLLLRGLHEGIPG